MRVSEGTFDINNIGVNETVKMQLDASAAGEPKSMSVIPVAFTTRTGRIGPAEEGADNDLL